MRYIIIINVEGELKPYRARDAVGYLFTRVKAVLPGIFPNNNAILHVSKDDPDEDKRWVLPSEPG